MRPGDTAPGGSRIRFHTKGELRGRPRVCRAMLATFLSMCMSRSRAMQYSRAIRDLLPAGGGLPLNQASVGVAKLVSVASHEHDLRSPSSASTSDTGLPETTHNEPPVLSLIFSMRNDSTGQDPGLHTLHGKGRQGPVVVQSQEALRAACKPQKPGSPAGVMDGFRGNWSSHLDPLVAFEHHGMHEGEVFSQVPGDEKILQHEPVGLPAHLFENLPVFEQEPDAQRSAFEVLTRKPVWWLTTWSLISPVSPPMTGLPFHMASSR